MNKRFHPLPVFIILAIVMVVYGPTEEVYDGSRAEIPYLDG